MSLTPRQAIPELADQSPEQAVELWLTLRPVKGWELTYRDGLVDAIRFANEEMNALQSGRVFYNRLALRLWPLALHLWRPPLSTPGAHHYRELYRLHQVEIGPLVAWTYSIQESGDIPTDGSAEDWVEWRKTYRETVHYSTDAPYDWTEHRLRAEINAIATHALEYLPDGPARSLVSSYVDGGSLIGERQSYGAIPPKPGDCWHIPGAMEAVLRLLWDRQPPHCLRYRPSPRPTPLLDYIAAGGAA